MFSNDYIPFSPHSPIIKLNKGALSTSAHTSPAVKSEKTREAKDAAHEYLTMHYSTDNASFTRYDSPSSFASMM